MQLICSFCREFMSERTPSGECNSCALKRVKDNAESLDNTVGTLSRTETRKHMEVMNAYLAGHPIQVLQIDGKTWVDVETPNWNWAECQYRIKPSGFSYNCPKNETSFSVFKYPDSIEITVQDKFKERVSLMLGLEAAKDFHKDLGDLLGVDDA